MGDPAAQILQQPLLCEVSGVINTTKTGGLLLSVFIASSKYQAGRGASI